MKHPLQVEFKVQSLVTSVWPVTPWHHQSPCKKIKANYCVLHWLLCAPWRLQSEMEQKIEDERQTQEEAAWLYPVRQAPIKVHQNDWEVTLTKNCLQGVSQACFEAPSKPVLEHVNPMQAAKVRKMELERDARQAWSPRGVTTVSHEARSTAPEHLSGLSNLSIFCWFQISSVASTSSALHIPWHPWTPTAASRSANGWSRRPREPCDKGGSRSCWTLGLKVSSWLYHTHGNGMAVESECNWS